MPKMKIAFHAPNRRDPDMGDLMASFILLSKEKGVKCKLTFPTEAIIEGDKKTLLEILDELDSTSFSTADNKLAISVEFDGSDDKPFTQEGEFLTPEIVEEAISREKSKTSKKIIHNMVMKRLQRYVKEENGNTVET
ncbi:MAG: hypothetical protein HYW01_05830 [Deltaproteobacteria bacterium]|nr:hypothetical protein [Deltaproteobacteria bacterium]